MNADLVALRDEIDARLAEVEASDGACTGHAAFARALGTLLRCQRAQLNERATAKATAARTGGVAGALLVGLVEAVRQVLGK